MRCFMSNFEYVATHVDWHVKFSLFKYTKYALLQGSKT